MLLCELLRDLAGQLDPALKIGDCAPRLKPAIEALRLPTWLMQLLWWSWVNKAGELRGIYFLQPVSKILKHRDLQRMLAERLLPIGSASQGDELVIRFQDQGGAVGLLSHEEIYSSPRLLDNYHEICPTLEEFLLRVVDRMFLPRDSYSAREYASLRAQMRTDTNTPSNPTPN